MGKIPTITFPAIDEEANNKFWSDLLIELEDPNSELSKIVDKMVNEPNDLSTDKFTDDKC